MICLASAFFRSSFQRRKRSFAFLEMRCSFGTVAIPCSSAKSLAPSPTRIFGGTLRRERGWLLLSRINLASEMGFLMPAYIGCVSGSFLSSQMRDHRLGPTGNSATSTASSQMVDYSCVTFDNSIHVEITSEAGICNFFVLQTPDSSFDGLGS